VQHIELFLGKFESTKYIFMGSKWHIPLMNKQQSKPLLFSLLFNKT